MQQFHLMDFAMQIISTLDNWMWGYYLVVLLLVMGLYFSISLNFPQITLIKYVWEVITERDPNAKGNKQHIAPYEALMISMGTRVGMGTIVGMAVAVVSGGPGAIVWLSVAVFLIWVAAFLNSAISVAENTLAQIYKSRDGGAFKGGPSYYLTKGPGSKRMALFYSTVLVLTGWSFTALYSYTIYSSFSDDHYFFGMATAVKGSPLSIYMGLLLALFAAMMFLGGGHYIAKCTSDVTPFMATGFIIISVISIMIHYEKAGQVLSAMMSDAFNFHCIFGGCVGSVLIIGIKRGLLSNEAGLGSAPCAVAPAHTSHPVKQEPIQAFCVFVATLIATLTVLFVLLSDSYSQTDSNGQLLTAMPLIQPAMREVSGVFGGDDVTLLIVALTFTVIVGAYYIGQMNVKYIRDRQWIVNLYRIITILVLFAGAQASLTLARGTASVVMGFIATINIVSVLLLSRMMKITLEDYRKQKQQGINPTLSATKLALVMRSVGINPLTESLRQTS